MNRTANARGTAKTRKKANPAPQYPALIAAMLAETKTPDRTGERTRKTSVEK